MNFSTLAGRSTRVDPRAGCDAEYEKTDEQKELKQQQGV